MPTAQQLIGLVKSHVRGDSERFYSLALQLAAAEARRGHSVVAEQLRELLEEAKMPRPRLVNPGHGPLPVPTVRGDLSGILSVSYPKTRLNQMILNRDLMKQLQRVVLEQRQRSKLHEHGFGPTRKLLLIGPPGSGKTMTSSAIAGELGLPLFTVLLHGIITRYMGESAAKLRLVFDAMAETRGVYLFDEFDALGTKRSAENDVGEARRILNSLLQFIENSSDDSIVIATTNHENLLDKALFRRFDAIIRYQLPTAGEIRQAISTRLSSFSLEAVDWNAITSKAHGLSQAEIIRAAENAARSAILSGNPGIDTDMISSALQLRLCEGK